jgi:2'-5' RNA ligase
MSRLLEKKQYQSRQRALVEDIVSGKLARRSTMSAVPIRSNWSQDDQRCLSIVSFVPNAVAKAIRTKVIEPLKALSPDHYFYPDTSLHLTIKNIRTLSSPPNFDESDIATACDVVRGVVGSHRPIRFELAELAPFSTSVSLIGYCSEDLHDLVRDLDRALRKAGLADDKRYASDSVYFGNITVCRYSRPLSESTAAAIRALEINPPIDLVVCNLSIAIFDSVCSPGSQHIAASIKLAK